MANHEWAKIEDAFRWWAFRVCYEKSFASEIDPTVRFVKALLASCQPIRNQQAVIEWYRKRIQRKGQPVGPHLAIERIVARRSSLGSGCEARGNRKDA